MKFSKTSIEGVLLAEPQVFGDARGFFLESYRKDTFAQNGVDVDFVQDNHSRSGLGVLRGLHYQVAPFEQAKLVRVIRGEAYDVVLDVRPNSKTFGRWEGHTLSADNRKMLFVPAGLAHGFLATAEDTEFAYKVSKVYSPAHERGILWNDPALGIRWPELKTFYLLSEKDKKFRPFKEIQF